MQVMDNIGCATVSVMGDETSIEHDGETNVYCVQDRCRDVEIGDSGSETSTVVCCDDTLSHDGGNTNNCNSQVNEQAPRQDEMDMSSFDDVCRIAMRMGTAAIKYGTTSGGVEKFLASFMHEFGYHGVFLATVKEMFCSFSRNPDDLRCSYTQIVSCRDGICLYKLALLSDLVTDLKKKSLTPQQASEKLDEIELQQSPWSTKHVIAAFLAVGASLAALFEGSWADVGMGTFCGGLVYWVGTYFQTLKTDFQQWLPLTASFLCSVLATTVKHFVPDINVTLVTLSGVAVLLPGYGVSLGTAELVTMHILSGLNRLLQGSVTLLWLLTGSTLGKRLVDAIIDVRPPDTQAGTISKIWYALFVPLLFLSVTVVLNNSHRDAPWAIACMSIAYGTSLVANTFMEINFGTFLSSVAMTLFANIWANKMDRPNTLVLVPAFLVKVSGSFGYLGLMRIAEGETFMGVDQFLQMFLIALLITAGMFAGNTLVPCGTIL